MDNPTVSPPPGVIADIHAVNPIYKWNILCQVLCLGTTTILVGIRVYTRLRILVEKKLGWDDYTCVIAWVMLVLYGVIASSQGLHHGGGQHIWNLPEHSVQENLYIDNVTQIFYGPMILFTKLSILLLYLNIFVPMRYTKTWWTIHIFMVGLFVFYVPVTFIKIFQCMPRRKIWDPKTPGSCVKLWDLLITTGSLNLATDVFLLVFPLSKIWSLQLRIKQQLLLTGIFLIGLIAPIATAFRLAQSVEFASSNDVTFNYYSLLLWTIAETATGIICACLPMVPAFFRHFYPKLKLTTSRSTVETNLSKPGISNFKAPSPNMRDPHGFGTWSELEKGLGMHLNNVTSTIEGGGRDGFRIENEGRGITRTAQIYQVEERGSDDLCG